MIRLSWRAESTVAGSSSAVIILGAETGRDRHSGWTNGAEKGKTPPQYRDSIVPSCQ